MERRLSTAEVARLLGLDERRVREWVRAGFGGRARRGRRYAVSFQELVVLRAAKELLERRVPAVRIRRALAALAKELPEGRPLSGVRIVADGREVAVRLEGRAWQPATGQALLFSVDELAERAGALTGASRTEPPGGEPAASFEEALALEDRDPDAARDAYRQLLARDPKHADALVNLGRLVHEGGEPREAVRLYREALRLAPDDPVVPYNLALALEDAGELEAAVAAYHRALALDPGFADAHFNLAGLYEALGRSQDAIRHYGEARRLHEGSGPPPGPEL